MSKNLNYSENFKKIVVGDFLILECVDEIEDKSFPIQKGTIQKWEVSEHDKGGLTMVRKIKGLPKQSIKIYNFLIKDSVLVAPPTFFMPISCKFKLSIEAKSDGIDKLKTIFSNF